MRRCTALITAGTFAAGTLVASCGSDRSTAPDTSGGTTGNKPSAAFTFTPTSPSAGQTVTFTDQSTGTPTSWTWNFGDNGTSTVQSPTHAYSAAGSYTVRLTVSNTAGRDSTTLTVAVAAGSGSSSFAPTYVRIPGGTYSMGDHHNFVDPEHPSDEIPLHNVTISSFYMSTTLVTTTEYVAYLNSALSASQIEVRSGIVYAKGGTTPLAYTSASVPMSPILYANGAFSSKTGRALHPAVGVLWHGAAAFANWLSARDGYTPCYNLSTGACDVSTGTGYRLPTEAEWEYAARGGQTNPYRQFPWGDDTNADGQLANWENSGDPWETGEIPRTTPVGFYSGALRQKSDYNWPGAMTTYQTRDSKNPYGLYDMAGNVWQWVNDWYHATYYQYCVTNNITVDPPGPESGTVFADHGNLAYRAFRGGTWFNGGGQQFLGYSRVSNRNPSWSLGQRMDDTPESSWLQVGFRLIRPDRSGSSVTRTVGLMLNNTAKAFDGYTLISPLHSPDNWLINNAGQYVKKWTAVGEPGRSSYLLENGHFIRSRAMPGVGPNTGGGEGGRIEEYDWDGNLVWAYDYYSSTYIAHHDFKVLPNGNVIIVAAEKKLYADVVQAGFNPANLDASITGTNGFMLPDYVIEVKPTLPSGGTIVWEWHIWDHLIQDFSSSKDNYGVVASHPELVDPNGSNGKINQFWNHVNGIDYNATFDQIMISVRGNSELLVIDHSTTTTEARSHSGGRQGKGGDILYRWGNASQYDRGTANERKLYQQHHTHWIESGLQGAGNILIFNNGLGRNYSSVDEIVPPVSATGAYTIGATAAFGPTSPVWTYVGSPTSSFFSGEISGAYRLPNGNTLITEGVKGNLFEVTSAGEIVWRYVNPVTTTPLTQGATVPLDANRTDQYMNAVFRVQRYAPTYPGLVGRTLTPLGTIEK